MIFSSLEPPLHAVDTEKAARVGKPAARVPRFRGVRIARRSGERALTPAELVYWALRCLIRDCGTYGFLAAISDFEAVAYAGK
jgi:hypothetical protein